MRSWLKLLGTADWPMADAWLHDRQELLTQARFADPPGDISKGDRLVYYAVGWQRFFAIAAVRSDTPYEAVHNPEWEARWPWVLDVVLEKKVMRISSAPSSLELGDLPDLRHKSYVPLTDGQLAKAKKLLG
jgi:hypothetical protein